MKNCNSQFEITTTFDDSEIMKRVISQNSILPVIRSYTSVNNSQILNTPNTKYYFKSISNNNNSRIQYNHEHKSNSNNIINTKYHHSELFNQNKKIFDKNTFSNKLFKNQIYITENINKRKSNSSFEEEDCYDMLSERKKESKLIFEKIRKKRFAIINSENRKSKIRKKISIRDYLDKTKELNLLKYSLNIKRERLTRLNEEKISKIYSIDNTIQSLKKSNELFVDNFYNKFNKYLNVLERRLNKEIIQNNKLLLIVETNQIELQNIKHEIKKKKLQKENIEKWFFFQIQVKEKLKLIPNYYYSIISESDCKKININENEIERIKKYKNNVIYEDLNDFMNEFKKIEENILKKSIDNQNIRNEINELKNRKLNLEKNLIKFEQNEIINIKEKEEILLNLKKNFERIFKVIIKNNLLDKFNSNLRNDLKNLSNKIGIYSKEINSKNNLFHSFSEKNLIKTSKKEKLSNLFLKINEIFKNILYHSNKKYNQTKIENSNESKMLNMLEFIEEVINCLLEKNKYYKKNPYLLQQFKEVLFLIDRKNKQKNSVLQKQILTQKRQEVIKQIEKRINKRYFIFQRKINIDYINSKNKKEKSKSLKKEKSKSLDIKDFMFDIE